MFVSETEVPGDSVTHRRGEHSPPVSVGGSATQENNEVVVVEVPWFNTPHLGAWTMPMLCEKKTVFLQIVNVNCSISVPTQERERHCTVLFFKKITDANNTLWFICVFRYFTLEKLQL